MPYGEACFHPWTGDMFFELAHQQVGSAAGEVGAGIPAALGMLQQEASRCQEFSAVVWPCSTVGLQTRM